ncbi:hypothetical protein L2E82_45785 [Cichorium intybus]|uniref:Uncharacterized protein n=1 Tax=Cichorium intybus TaxID=13427 RepID=A0ACB8ZYC1_CICIN|nr:hypothetical protein L2E82_45785 [Cichorium intybus]
MAYSRLSRRSSNNLQRPEPNDEESAVVGLTIWRLPGGGFAVGRFTGGRRTGSGKRELPVVYTEADGGFSDKNFFNHHSSDFISAT